jgi:hypothetical protein
MAKKQADPIPKPPVQRSGTATNFRLTPRCHSALDALSTSYGTSKASMVEASVLLLQETLGKASPIRAKAIVESVKNPK